MKRYIILLTAMLSFMQLTAKENLDRTGKIAKDFKARREVVTGDGYFDIFSSLTGSKLQAMQFLYAYMPLPDIADYSAEFRSLSFADFTAPREQDGSLPNNGFGALLPHSKLRNLGTPIRRVVPRRFITEKRKERLGRITIPYRGSAPDLGAREE